MSEATPTHPGRPPMDVEKALDEAPETSGKIAASVAAVRAQLEAFIAPVIDGILTLRANGDEAGQIQALYGGRDGLDAMIGWYGGIRGRLLDEYEPFIPNLHERDCVVQRMIVPIQMELWMKMTRASSMKPEHFHEFYSPAPEGGLRRYGKKEVREEVKEEVADQA